MRYGVSMPNMGDPAALVEVAVAAAEAGWDGFFVWDHLHFVREMRLEVHDPWVLLGAVAARTSLVVGPLVTPVGRRQPWELAKQMVTLDHLSGGRAVLGVGLGEPGDQEFGAFGLPVDARVRAERLDEGLDVVAGLWSGERYRHAGAHFSVDAELHPSPVQRPRPPVWVAGMWGKRRPFERARRWDGYVPIDPQTMGPMRPEAVAEVKAALAGAPPEFDLVATVMGDTPMAAYEEAGATWAVQSVWPMGPWVHELRARVEAGPLG